MSAQRLIEVRRTDGGPIDEFVTAEAIQPGRLVEIQAAGTIRKNELLSRRIPIIVALADVLQGKETGHDELAGQTETSAWANGDTARVYTPRSGDLVALRLADGQNAGRSDRLVPAADGYVSVVEGDSSATDDEGVFAIAEEALDLSDSSAAESTNLFLARII